MKNLSINEIIFYLIVIFPITTVLQGLPIFGNINKFMMFFLLIFLFFSIIFRKISKEEFCILIITFILYIIAFLYTKTEVDINVWFYYIIWILYFIFLNRNYEKLINLAENNLKFIELSLIVWNLIVFISFFSSSSYITSFFSPFSCGEHRFGSCCLMITALNFILVLKKKKRKYFIYSVIPIIGICLCAARTYLAIYLVLIICIFYLNCKKKSTFYIMIIPMLIAILLLIYISPVGNKIQETNTNGYLGLLGTITSGRSVFWVYDMNAFFDLSFWQQFVGNGFDFVYNINLKYANQALWAHNDFINILMNFGYIGLVLYFYVFRKFSKKALEKNKIKRIQKYSFYFIWFFNAFFNMVYTYTIATLAIPFIMYAITNEYHMYDEESDKKDVLVES